MSAEAPTAAPLVENDPLKRITLYVRMQEGAEFAYKINPETPLLKIMERVALATDQKLRVMRFLVDGHRICGKKSANELFLTDGDYIEVVTEMLGGGK